MSPFLAHSQIDPYPRELIQVGYNASFEGHAPLAGYAFYYRNQPNFLQQSNLTLRLAIAPTYVDSELGFSHLLGQNTDVGVGIAGGGFADSYSEIKGGTYFPKESFDGDGGETSLSLYHCFNPNETIPLNGVLRGSVHYSTYSPSDTTARNFQVPSDETTFAVRTGLRWGGKEPILFPSLAMELSVWYEGQFRLNPDTYGFATSAPFGSAAGDRHINFDSHLFWATALLAYTMTNSGQSFFINLTAGTSINADRFSAYRLGALLPLVSEFPLSLPGYYYQEISARQFLLVGANYIIPMDKKDHWNVNFTAATAKVAYLEGFRQPGDWLSGVGAGVLYKTKWTKVMVGYAYGIDAIRDGGRGAHSVGFLMQFDLGHAKQDLLNPGEPSRWRGWGRIASGIFGD
ncbi:MAG TPA: hypothetical protein VN873_19295 [Candidatus Angelobacter sp.]|nr:hypothetical protein [Candidatus Angelobacter sp.]